MEIIKLLYKSANHMGIDIERNVVGFHLFDEDYVYVGMALNRRELVCWLKRRKKWILE